MSFPAIYTGTHRLAFAEHLERAMISVNLLERRIKPFRANRWILDSGAFTRITGGREHMPVAEYAAQVERWAEVGQLDAAVAQDYMCEPFVLGITGLDVATHQALSTERYLALRELVSAAYVMPVIQGFDPAEYAAHATQLAPYLPVGAWVGVGSVCKRNGRPVAISAVLSAILAVRPDLKLHGFGVKTTALTRADIAERLHSADSMAWSANARWYGRDANSLAECLDWTAAVNDITPKPSNGAFGL